LYLFKRKYYLFSIPALFYVLFYILKFLPLDNFWMNLSGFLVIFPNSMIFFGSYLTLYLLLLFNVLFFNLVFYLLNHLHFKRKFFKINKFGVLNIFLFLFLFFNFFLLNFVFDFLKDETKKGDIGVLGVQGNLEQDWYERSEKKWENFDLYKKLSLNGIAEYGKENVDVLIWPEYTFTDPIEYDIYFLKQLSDFSIKNDLVLMVGSILLENRTINNSRRFNTLFIFDGGNLSFYNAYEPIMILDDMAVKAESNYPVFVNNVSLGLGLCFEENFPKIYRNEVVLNNASVFFTIGNQYYIKNENGLKLTSLNSNLRAVENNRYLFRLETGGLTTVIDNYGVNRKSISINEKGYLFYEMPLIHEKAFYSLYGDLIDLLLLACSCFFLFIAYFFKA
ncbi:MAG: hypothetical protein KC589_02870, partial [Nanoarchaeota archaeon]|nr:hypothetical protein [Nanoarchaeota archaeon]